MDCIYFSSQHLGFSLFTAQNMKFSVKDTFSKCEQIRSFLLICSHLLEKFITGNFNFCAVIFHDIDCHLKFISM